ncbi:MAG: helix-turn-helix transcriptional regulator [Eubacteriales bacterium]|nr:helix-turn-helix transcriptional regulator [Eubacteriales bacterium]
MSQISAAIGKQIRKIRNAQGITLEELSFKSGLNAAHLGQIERGLRNPTVETLERIADALEVSFLDLVSTLEQALPEQDKTDVVKRKIDAQLSSMTLDELEDILRIIRIFRRQFKQEEKAD